jgi:DNA polymerase-3 subunit epsilon
MTWVDVSRPIESTLKRALILDTETSGLDPAVDKVIEVACVLYDLELALPIASYASLVRAESNAAENINRIPSRALLDAPDRMAVWRAVTYFILKADVILAHRAEFDRSFTPAEVATLRPWVCTKLHVSWPHSKMGEHLVHLVLAHGIGVLDAHRALSDCQHIQRLLTRVHEMGHPLPALIEHAMRPRVRLQSLQAFDDNDKAKALGFMWDPGSRRWLGEVAVDDVAALPFQTRAL